MRNAGLTPQSVNRICREMRRGWKRDAAAVLIRRSFKYGSLQGQHDINQVQNSNSGEKRKFTKKKYLQLRWPDARRQAITIHTTHSVEFGTRWGSYWFILARWGWLLVIVWCQQGDSHLWLCGVSFYVRLKRFKPSQIRPLEP